MPERGTGFGAGKPFQPGNQAARGKHKPSITRVLNKWLEQNPDEIELVIQSALHHARAGDPAFLKLIWDRTDGPVAQKIEMAVNEELVSAVERAIQQADIPAEVKVQIVESVFAEMDEIVGRRNSG